MLHVLLAASDENESEIVLVKIIGATVAIVGSVFTFLTARNNSRVSQLIDHVSECDRDRSELRSRCDRLERESKDRDEADRQELQSQIDESKVDRARINAMLLAMAEDRERLERELAELKSTKGQT